jgi:hypothetical protein
LHVEGVVFDELAAGGDFVAHEEGEQRVGFGGVVDGDFEEAAFSGSIVVSKSCFGFISPRPL